MRPSRSFLFLALICGPAPLFAQDPDSLRVDSTRVARQYELEGITVGVARPALTTGGSSAVEIRLDSLGAPPAPTMEEVLRAMPLVVIRRNSRGEAQPALRGSEDRQIGILMDGIPLTIGWDHRTDLSIIPLTAAQSIRLVRGLSSVLYGPNTLGGVIEVDVARVPGRIESVTPLSLGLSLDHNGGRTMSVGAARLLGEDSQWMLRAGGGFQDTPGFALPGGLETAPDIRRQFLNDPDGLRLNSDARRVDAYVATRYRTEDGAWTSFTASAFDVERGVVPEAHQDEPRLWRYPEQKRLVTAFSAGTGVRETSRGSGDIDLSIGVDVGTTHIDQYGSELFQTVEEREEADDRTLTFRLEADHTAGARGDLRSAFTYSDVSHDEVLTPGGENSYRQRLWSFGLESEWRLGESERTRVTFGGSLDGADTPESGDKPPLDRLSDLGGRIGVSSLAGEGLLLHGGMSRRSRFPSLRELYSGALGRFEPNPELTSETLLGIEGGFTLEVGSAEVQLVGFHQRLDNGIIRTRVPDGNGSTRFKRINQDQVRSTGGEVLTITRLGPSRLSADLTVQSVRGYDADGSEVELEYEPSVTGKVGWEIPVGTAFRISGGLNFVGRQSCENPEVGGLQPLASSTLVDVALRRLFTFSGAGSLRRIDASATVSNLGDVIAFDQCGLPQAGRTLQLQLQVF